MVAGHGPSRRELQVLELQERGKKPREIAAELGLKLSVVQNILSHYCVTAAEPWKDSARAGSAALLAAIIKHHPEVVRA